MRHSTLPLALSLQLISGCAAPDAPAERDDSTAEHGLVSTHPDAIRVTVLDAERIVFSTERGGCPPEHPRDLDLPDGPVRAFRDATGTIQLISPSHPTHRMIGPSFDALARPCAPVLRSGYDLRYETHDNVEWLWATYRHPSGVVFGLVHDEWHPGLDGNASPW